MQHPRVLLAFAFAGSTLAATTLSAQRARQPLGVSEVDDIAHILEMENGRQFDSITFARVLASSHAEVRRRAVLAVGRILDKRGFAMLRARPLDADTSIAATAVFAIGQFRDSQSVAWLDSLLSAPPTPPTIADEAAIALGKIRSPSVRVVLARYLDAMPPRARYTPALGSALLSIGRGTRGDLAPIVKWTTSPDEELRWRAAWSLYRPRDPAAVSTLLTMTRDRSALVRSWAVRGLARPQADSAAMGTQAEAALIAAVRDVDRRVQSEAVRTLGTYSDSAAIAVLSAALRSPDTWVAIPAAEGLARLKVPSTVPALAAATNAGRPCAVRAVAMQSLQSVSEADALRAALDVAHDSVSYCRNAALQLFARVERGATVIELDPSLRSATLASLDTLRHAYRTSLASSNVVARLVALRAINAWADSSDLPVLADVQQRATGESPAVASLATAVIASVRRRLSGPATRTASGPRPIVPVDRPFADYQQIVRRWIVPEYNGAKRAVARWTTPQGTFDVELYGGDAPLAADDFVRTMESGVMLGTEFTRVVPDFVAQQQTIRAGNVLRDEVNRRGLVRGNLAWATAGLDTGSPGYTLGHTPQPHNEGDFTSLGRVIRGLDVVDRLQLGDRIVAARMLP